MCERRIIVCKIEDKLAEGFKEAIGEMFDMGMSENEIGQVILDTLDETLSEKKYQDIINANEALRE